jgi:hypothetical protein
MTLPMTTIDGVPNRPDSVPGMAFFARTGPQGKTCGDCTYKGYHRATLDGSKTYRVPKCQMTKKLTGKHGADIGSHYPSCKYFEAKK